MANTQFFRRDRIDYHQNARLTVWSREQMAHMALSTGCTTHDFFARPALLTDNGSSYRSHRFRAACQTLEIKHHRTKPYRKLPESRTLYPDCLREWAYAKHWTHSNQRDAYLQPWTDYYNRQRPHGSLNYEPPISRSEIGTTS